MILLDTNALIWLHRDHPRGRPLARWAGRLYISPANLLEIQILVEVGRVRLRRGATVGELATDGRWLLDDPASAAWFDEALRLGWTRDPFDRLLVAHAHVRRWRLATADEHLLDQLPRSARVEL